MRRTSIWRDKKAFLSFPALEGKHEFEVAIIGAGITGLTAALELVKSGKSVAVLEAEEIGLGTTGFSSCHLTTDLDEEYRNIASDFNEETARKVAMSRVAGIDFIEKTVKEESILCDFRRVPGYFYTEMPEHVADLRDESEAASGAGLKVKLQDSAPLPFIVNKALLFEDQAQFNSYEYLLGLAEAISLRGGRIFENTRVRGLHEEDGKYLLETANGTIVAHHVFHATQIPLFVNILQTVSAPYMSYMIAAKLKRPEYPVGLFWDTADPYHYTRFYSNENGSYVVVGGADHKTGHLTDTQQQFDKLEKYVRERFDIESVDYRWSAQYYEPADGLPYIGKSPFSRNVYVATGFSGDGLVYGTIAGLIVADLINEKENPWHEVYDSTRFTLGASAGEFVKENADVAKHFIKDRIRAEGESVEDLKPGEGKVLKVEGEKVAVARGDSDELYAVSPVCPHMKCFVHWNTAERTWDCPCHGSRFLMEGKVIYGPAVTDLTPKEVKAGEEKNK